MFFKTYKNIDLSKYNTAPFEYQCKSNIAVLVIHGLSASCQQMFYINQALKENNYNVICHNLAGHGTKLEDLNSIKYFDWISQIENLFRDLRNKYEYVFIVGLSLGGLLSLYLATQNNNIDGIVIINTAVKFYGLSSSIYITPFFRYILKYSANPRIFIKDPNSVDKFTYPFTSVSASAECLKLARLVKKNLNKCIVPAYIFKSIDDKFLRGDNGKNLYDSISSKKKYLKYLYNSSHDAVLDYDKDIIVEEILKFFKEIRNGNKS